MNKKALRKLSYGLYLISSRREGRFNGQIADVVFQVTSGPPMIAMAINKKNLTHEFIKESGVFTISVLSKEAPMRFIGHFGFRSGRDIDKFKNVNYKIGITKAPVVLENTVAYLECEVVKSVDVGSHTLFIGRVVDAQVLSDVEPMSYAYYHEIKGGVTPKTAPTYEEKEREVDMKKYKCKVCGYIYDPRKGDPEGGIKPNTSFERLPSDWVCPLCGAGKDQFEPVEE